METEIRKIKIRENKVIVNAVILKFFLSQITGLLNKEWKYVFGLAPIIHKKN